MEINATLPPPGSKRNLRLDLVRGVANWAIYLDHVPNNVMNWVTTTNYGPSNAADIFVFIAGYTAAFVYARMMVERGFILCTTRMFKRVRQLYIAHVFLLTIYMVAVSYLAKTYSVSDIITEFNVESLVSNPIETLREGLILNFRPLNLDILPLYIVLMVLFPPVLWIMIRKPDLTMFLSMVLYIAARQLGWNLNAYPAGTWYFNPFCWQVLFLFGAWFALGGAQEVLSVISSPVVLYCGVGYLLFSLAMTMAGRAPNFGVMLPQWLFDAFNPGDKGDLSPYRVLHFFVITFFVAWFATKECRGLEWWIFDPIIKCGQSIAVFCVGLFLSFAARFVLMMSTGSLFSQIVVGVSGVVIMTIVAYYISWSKKEDEILQRPASATTPKPY